MPKGPMKRISFLSSELGSFPKISEATPLLSNHVDSVRVFGISRLIQPGKALKISNSLIKLPFALHLSEFHIRRRQIAVSLQIPLMIEKYMYNKKEPLNKAN